jgi:tRNA (cmo5U34)-methyltransferase
MTFQHYDFKRENFEAVDILEKEKSLRSIMKPLTIQENFEFLENAGFKVFDVFFQNFNFVSILAIK